MKNRQKVLNIGYLYGDIMNTYGDVGNIITLQKRCEWRGIDIKIKNISIGEKLKSGEIDLYFFGGGQDAGQEVVGRDLASKKKILLSEIVRGVPLLAICGGYQLLGSYYRPHQGEDIPGAGILPIYTVAGDKRMIGNLVIRSEFGGLVGFENHSGQTFLEDDAKPLGQVIVGFGNNGQDQTEGCIYQNALGCYLHGSLLPKNPVLADWLISKALELKYDEAIELRPLDDELEISAHDQAIERFSK